MEQWSIILTAVLAVFLIAGIGTLCRAWNWLTPEADATLLKLVVRLLYPALAFKLVLGNPALNDPVNVWVPPIVGFVTITAGVAVAGLVARLFRHRHGLSDPAAPRTFAAVTGMYNYGYIPIPLITALFDRDTAGVLFVHNLGVELAMWTVVLLTIGGGLTPGWYKRLINPPVIAIVAALILNAIGAAEYTPGFVLNVIDWLGNCAIPIALLLIGATVWDQMSQFGVRGAVWPVALGSALRLGLLPLAFLGLAVSLPWVVPASVELQRVIVVQAAMPCAVFPIVLARHYGGHPVTAVRVVVATSLLSLLTMPAWLMLGLRWLG